jgi:excisionase family DNA binding protein
MAGLFLKAMSMTKLLSVREAKSRLGFGLTKFYDEVKAGRLQLLKAGRRSLISEAEIERYAAALPRHGRTEDSPLPSATGR